MKTKDGAELCFPQLLNISCKKQKLCWSELVFLNILLSSISLLTVVLNLLVIISVSHFRQLHTPTNILLLSLAVSDFLVGLLLLPAEILQKTARWILGDLMCSLYYYMIYIITSASIGVMVLISVDRYVAICHPLHYSTILKMQHSVSLKKKSELKAARTLGVLVLVFLICFCPYYYVTFACENVVSAASVSFVVFLFYFNSCLNPMIYALCYPWFRKTVKLIVTLQILQPGSVKLT
ncbi:trace amine-associated receptor 1-like [Pelmatolapia mariae]|uniref:trace amine-associated receptor 1-like n=1 Tax=Pelmatolapia mariae TaxID=158779 RepID=UPI002FE60B2F